MMTNPGKSAIAESHPLSLGGSTRSRPRMVSEFMDRADLVFAIGSSLTITNFGPKVPLGKKIVHSTNDPSDINKDYLADHAVIGDAKMVAEALIKEIKTKFKTDSEIYGVPSFNRLFPDCRSYLFQTDRREATTGIMRPFQVLLSDSH